MTDTLIRGHLDQTLSNFTIGLARNQSLIGDTVAPVVRVSNMSDAYVEYGADQFRLESMGYGGKGTIGRVAFTETLAQYLTQEYALEAALPWSKLRNADAALRLEMRAAAGVANKMRLAREKAVADVVFATGTFTNTAALSGSDRWDTDTSSPVAKVADAKEAIRALIGIEPNTLVIGAHVWAHLRIHPDVCQRILGLAENTPVSEAQAAAALGLDRVLVGKAVYTTTAEAAAPATPTLVDIWGKYASVCYIEPANAGVEGTITPAVQFECDAVAAPFSTFTYEENQTRTHVIQCYDNYQVKAICVNSAYLYSTVVS